MSIFLNASFVSSKSQAVFSLTIRELFWQTMDLLNYIFFRLKSNKNNYSWSILFWLLNPKLFEISAYFFLQIFLLFSVCEDTLGNKWQLNPNLPRMAAGLSLCIMVPTLIVYFAYFSCIILLFFSFFFFHFYFFISVLTSFFFSCTYIFHHKLLS